MDARLGLGPIITMFPGAFPAAPWLLGLNAGRYFIFKFLEINEKELQSCAWWRDELYETMNDEMYGNNILTG